MRSLTVLLLTSGFWACKPGSVLLNDSAPESTPPEDSPQPVDSEAPSDPWDTGPPDDVGGVDNMGLCQMTLDCEGEIVDEPGVTCKFTVTDAAGYTRYEGRASVETRGRSSSAFPKEQFGVELQDSSGAAVEVDLLGMGAESDWVLNGAWIDRALLRNPLAFDLFRDMGRYAPEQRHCWLTLNDKPWGIYFLGERVKQDKVRLNLTEDPNGGSFLLKLDDEGGIRNTYGNGYWETVWPDPATDVQRSGISERIKAWDSAIASGSGDKLFEVLDRDMAIDLVILEELMRNNDGYYLSLYLFSDAGAPLGWVPWDLDLTLGQPSYNDNENPKGWIAYRPSFIGSFANDPSFQRDLSARWVELRAGPLSDEAILARVDTYVATMGDAAYDNFEVWPIEDVTFGDWAGTNYLYKVSSYDEELARVKAWIPKRTAWIDSHIKTW